MKHEGTYYCPLIFEKGPEYSSGRGERMHIDHKGMTVSCYECLKGNGYSAVVESEKEALGMVREMKIDKEAPWDPSKGWPKLLKDISQLKEEREDVSV